MRILLRRRSMKKPAAAAINTRAPSATPTPIPIFAPWLRPLLPLFVVPAVVLEEGVGDAVVSGLVLTFVPVVAVDEFPVFWLQVTGLALLSIATLNVPLRAKGGPNPTAGLGESSKWQLNGSSA